MTNMGIFAALIGAGILSPHDIERKEQPAKPKKECLNCGKEHEHNNNFCSADCCKKFKEDWCIK